MKWVTRLVGPWTGLNWVALRPDQAALDPYLLWAELDGFRAFRSQALAKLPVLVELDWETLQKGVEKAEAAEPKKLKLSGQWLNTFFLSAEQFGIVFSTIYITNALRIVADTEGPFSLADLPRFLTGDASPVFFTKTLAGELSNLFKRVEFGLPITDREGFHQQGLPQEGLVANPNQAPVVGVIDDGIALAHRRFRMPGGQATRVALLWDQDNTVAGAASPRGVGYGVEIQAEAVNDLLRETPPLDEPEIYTRLAYRRARRRVTHGTHVLCVAAGSDDGNGPPIIAVQLPRDVVRDTSAVGFGPHVLDAIHYILCHARGATPAGREPPEVSVNLSYVSSRGMRNGSSMLEAAFEDLSTRASRRASFSIVVPSGNHRLARGHATLDLASGQDAMLPWRILPDDRTPSFLEIWCDADPLLPDGTSRLEVTVQAPGLLPASGPVDCPGIRALEGEGGPVCTVICLNRVAGGRGTMVLVAVSPTASFDDQRPLAPAGLWQVGVKNRGEPVQVQAWVQRDDSIEGFSTFGRQSYFDDAADRRAEQFGPPDENEPSGCVRRERTLSGAAGAAQPLTVAGYRAADGKMARYSAGGATGLSKPDVAALSDRSVVLSGVLGAGTFSGSTVALNGTSVAVPQVVRLLATGVGPGRRAVDFVRAHAHDAQHSPEHSPEVLPPERAGDGRLPPPQGWDTGRRPLD